MDEKLYELFKSSMDNQQKSIEYLTGVVEKITDSQESTMLLLDETNRRTQEHADKESTNWRNGIIAVTGIICLLFLGIVITYFVSPWSSSSESTSTSISTSYSTSNDGTSEQDYTVESEGD